MYKKELEVGKDIVFKNPAEIGGHKSEEFLKINAQGPWHLLSSVHLTGAPCHDHDPAIPHACVARTGKFPVLVSEHGNIPESDTIARYLLERCRRPGPKWKGVQGTKAGGRQDWEYALFRSQTLSSCS